MSLSEYTYQDIDEYDYNTYYIKQEVDELLEEYDEKLTDMTLKLEELYNQIENINKERIA